MNRWDNNFQVSGKPGSCKEWHHWMGISGCLQAGFIAHAESAGWEVMGPSQLLSNVSTPQQLRNPASSITRFYFLFLSLQNLKIRFSLKSYPSLTSIPNFYGKLGWSICSPVCERAMAGWDFNYRKAAEMTPMLHGKCMECWHLPAKGFMSLLDRNLPTSTSQKLIPISHAQQPAKAGTESSMTPNMKMQSYPYTMKQQHECPAPWRPVALGQSKEFPTSTGINVYFESQQNQQGLTVPEKQIFCSWKSADLI